MTSFMDGCQALFFSLYLSSLQKSSPIAVAGHKKVILSTLYYGILCCIHTYGASGTLVEFEIACIFHLDGILDMSVGLEGSS